MVEQNCLCTANRMWKPLPIHWVGTPTARTRTRTCILSHTPTPSGSLSATCGEIFSLSTNCIHVWAHFNRLSSYIASHTLVSFPVDYPPTARSRTKSGGESFTCNKSHKRKRCEFQPLHIYILVLYHTRSLA